MYATPPSPRPCRFEPRRSTPPAGHPGGDPTIRGHVASGMFDKKRADVVLYNLVVIGEAAAQIGDPDRAARRTRRRRDATSQSAVGMNVSSSASPTSLTRTRISTRNTRAARARRCRRQRRRPRRLPPHTARTCAVSVRIRRARRGAAARQRATRPRASRPRCGSDLARHLREIYAPARAIVRRARARSLLHRRRSRPPRARRTAFRRG
jgi:hypothetical protein